jgi:hypothetical protein
MSGLENLQTDVTDSYDDIDREFDLDREAKNELAMLAAGLGTDPDQLVERAVHLLFQTTVDSGKLDFHLRSAYDVTYDEYLSGMTYEEMTGGSFPQPETNDDRRYQF